MFVGLAILPLLVVFYFSIQFINSGIDSWFSIEIEEGLDDALALSRAALGMQMRGHLETTVRIADRLEDTNPRQLVYELSSLRRQSGASEISIYGRNSRILATSSDQSADSLPTPLTDEVALQIRQNRPYVSLDPIETGGFEIRAAVPFGSNSQRDLQGVIQALFPVSERVGTMADNVDSSYKRLQAGHVHPRGPEAKLLADIEAWS